MRRYESGDVGDTAWRYGIPVCIPQRIAKQKRGRSVVAPPYHSFIGSLVVTDRGA